MMTTMTTQKRKAVDQVNHDFSDFSLSSPATKIRRLDHVELAPIIEEEEDEQVQDGESIAASAENEERAIVLFNPTNNTLIHPPPTLSLTPHILSRLKGQSQQLWSNLFNNSSEDEVEVVSNQCTAVVPWVNPSPWPQTQTGLHQLDGSESMMMEADIENQQEVTSMDIEQEYDSHAAATRGNASEYGGGPSVGFHEWQQQHCMVPSQLPLLLHQHQHQPL